MTRRIQILLAISGMMVAAAVMLVCAWASIEYSSGHDPLSLMRGSTVRTVGIGSFYGQAREYGEGAEPAAPEASADSRDADVAPDDDMPPAEDPEFVPEKTTLSEEISSSGH